MNFDHNIKYFDLNDLQKYYSFEIPQKYRSQHLSFLKGGGPKFKGLLRRQDMLFVDIIIIGDEGNSDDFELYKII